MLRTLDRRPLILLLALGVGACSGAGWGRPDYGAIFDQVVFGGAPGAPNHDRVYRWGGPIRVAVRGEVEAARAALVDEALSELRALTGVDMVPAGAGAGANIVIYFEDGEAFLEHLTTAGTRVDDFLAASFEEGFCWSTYWAHGARIVGAAVFVTGGEPGPGRGGRTRRCLNHEMEHVLGLTYHPADAYSVLDDHTASDRYTPTDAMLLRLLYAPDLSLGMPRAEALAAVARLLPRLSP